MGREGRKAGKLGVGEGNKREASFRSTQKNEQTAMDFENYQAQCNM